MNHDSTHQEHQKETGNGVKKFDKELEEAQEIMDNEDRSGGAQNDE